mmetsp:Transcript_5165/g.12934  ORF Transcript_5165/g.12934 Transcript_5165/m.12934 type:complete len:446 (-) Transcript_5165:347-1684(-)
MMAVHLTRGMIRRRLRFGQHGSLRLIIDRQPVAGWMDRLTAHCPFGILQILPDIVHCLRLIVDRQPLTSWRRSRAVLRLILHRLFGIFQILPDTVLRRLLLPLALNISRAVRPVARILRTTLNARVGRYSHGTSGIMGIRRPRRSEHERVLQTIGRLRKSDGATLHRCCLLCSRSRRGIIDMTPPPSSMLLLLLSCPYATRALRRPPLHLLDLVEVRFRARRDVDPRGRFALVYPREVAAIGAHLLKVLAGPGRDLDRLGRFLVVVAVGLLDEVAAAAELRATGGLLLLIAIGMMVAVLPAPRGRESVAVVAIDGPSLARRVPLVVVPACAPRSGRDVPRRRTYHLHEQREQRVAYLVKALGEPRPPGPVYGLHRRANVSHLGRPRVDGRGVRELLEQDVIRPQFELLVVQDLVVVIEFLEGGVYRHEADVAGGYGRVEIVQYEL